MNKHDDNIVKIAKALSDKTRIKILKEIAEKGRMSCGDVEKVAGLSQPTVSHHLKILIDAGVLDGEKAGRHVILSVNEDSLNKFSLNVSEAIKK